MGSDQANDTNTNTRHKLKVQKHFHIFSLVIIIIFISVYLAAVLKDLGGFKEQTLFSKLTQTRFCWSEIVEQFVSLNWPTVSCMSLCVTHILCPSICPLCHVSRCVTYVSCVPQLCFSATLERHIGQIICVLQFPLHHLCPSCVFSSAFQS